MSGHGSPLPALRLAGFTAEERGRIERAYGLAARCHEGQLRKSGEPYIVHPVAVAEIAIEVGMDCASVCAALLHDVVDGGCDTSRLRTEFGDEIAVLVQGVMDLDRRYDEEFLEAADERSVALKVFDRLHNMRTLQYLDQEKQRRKSQETLDLIAPIAGRLGLDAIAVELASIARNYLGPLNGAAYQALALGAHLFLPVTVRASYLEEWLGELDEVHARRARIGFTFRVVVSMPAMAFALRRPPRHALTGRFLDALRWIVRSDLRTWTPLTVLLAWMTMETAENSLGDAVAILITVPPVLHAGVTRLRMKLGLNRSKERR